MAICTSKNIADYSQMVGLYQDPQGEMILTQHAQYTQEKELDKDKIDFLKKRITELENLVVQQVCFEMKIVVCCKLKLLYL